MSNLVAFFIILTTAVTLNAAGKTDIQTSADAAEALRPIAGNLAFALFSLGIIGTGLLAVPVLAGSAIGALTEPPPTRRAVPDTRTTRHRDRMFVRARCG